MKIAFINNSKSFAHSIIKNYNANPGIGGTEYITFKLLYELAIRRPGWKFYLITEQHIQNNTGLSNIQITDKVGDLHMSVCIVPTSHFKYFNKLKIQTERKYGWSHHPHDQSKINLKIFDSMISIGEYQYHSNFLRFGHHHLIKNPFPKPNINSVDEKKTYKKYGELNFIYLGGVNHAKGLHIVLKNWYKIINHFPKSKLHVIGGDLYNEKQPMSEECILVGGNYGILLKKIFMQLPQNARNNIKFYGKLDMASEKAVNLLKKSDIALLNPTGKSEAAPGSPFECLSYGVPPMAGGDFGMSDIMNDFDKLDTLKYDIRTIVKKFRSRDFLDLQTFRSLKLANNNYEENENIFEDWINLISSNNLKTKSLNTFKFIRMLPRSIFYNYLRLFLKNIFIKFIKS